MISVLLIANTTFDSLNEVWKNELNLQSRVFRVKKKTVKICHLSIKETLGNSPLHVRHLNQRRGTKFRCLFWFHGKFIDSPAPACFWAEKLMRDEKELQFTWDLSECLFCKDLVPEIPHIWLMLSSRVLHRLHEKATFMVSWMWDFGSGFQDIWGGTQRRSTNAYGIMSRDLLRDQFCKIKHRCSFSIAFGTNDDFYSLFLSSIWSRLMT